MGPDHPRRKPWWPGRIAPRCRRSKRVIARQRVMAWTVSAPGFTSSYPFNKKRLPWDTSLRGAGSPVAVHCTADLIVDRIKHFGSSMRSIHSQIGRNAILCGGDANKRGRQREISVASKQQESQSLAPWCFALPDSV